MVSTQATEERSPDERAANRPFYRIILSHHTHWDREWWATYQDFRFRLVELIDNLLDALDHDPEFRSFLLDGQTVVLRDYLEVRPENQAKLTQYMRDGRIQCGPWYILPDEFLVSGEAHIRNLWLGRRVASDLDIPVLKVGYIPDTFGHISQMPQILRGFGIDNAFMWRGRGGDPATVKQEFRWIALDGSDVLAHWFPEGYYQMPFLHFDNPDRPYEDKMGRVFRMIDTWAPRATAGVLLMPYGGDHQAIDRRLPAKIRLANESLKDKELGEIEWGTLDEYLEAVRKHSPALEEVHGELRAFGSNHPCLLPGVLSTRLYLKRLNAAGQTWLERYAEPLSALSWLGGGRYDTGLLWRAWELLVQNHPHDSICGCSIDQVHREMIPRFDQSHQIAQILTEKAAQHINTRIDTSRAGPGEQVLVVHNTLPWERAGWASVWMPRAEIHPRTHRLVNADDQEVPFAVKDVEGPMLMSDRWQYTEIGFMAERMPGLGYRTYRLMPRERPLDPRQVFFTAIQPVARLKGSVLVTDLLVGNNALENRWLRVEVDPLTGTIAVTDKRTGQTYGALNAFEDRGDAGDEYNYSQPLSDMLLRSSEGAQVHVSVAEAGYARATLRVDLDWPLPTELSPDRLSRASSDVPTHITTFVTLLAGVPRVDITTEWENLSRDHRLRALFPLGERVDVAHTHGHFSVEHRPVAVENPGNGWPETYVPTVPQQGWVSVNSGERGLTIASRGLPEVETLEDGTVALTILRSVGWLSREDMLARNGGAGPALPTPEAQCLGHNQVSYAIIPHAGSWLDSRAYLEAEEFLVPLYGSLTDSHSGEEPESGGLIELAGQHTLLPSALKRAEAGDELIFRVWNVGDGPTEAHVILHRPLVKARYVDLKEDLVENGDIALEEGGFTLSVKGAGIATVALTLGK